MTLRETGRAINKTFDVQALMDTVLDIGVDGGDVLLNFANAVLGHDPDVLARARDSLAVRLGPSSVAGASIIAGNFTKNDLIANGIGIPTDPMFIKGSEAFRDALGVNDFPSAKNSLDH